MLILGIETSCDETAFAVIEDGRRVLASVIASQADLHAEYGGVVPEIASRAHVERLVPTLRRALGEAGVGLEDLGAVAIGHRPGLIGSLLVGVSAAKALAWSLGVALVGVDHVHAHLYAGCLERDLPEFPAMGLVVSGGHTSIYLVRSVIELERLGSTIDDAVGEAYDKAAMILGLGYPGGALLDALAQQGDPKKHQLPISRLGRESLDFSFSGLKTSLLYRVRGKPGPGGVFQQDHGDLSETEKADFAAGFQAAAVGAVILKLGRAFEQLQERNIEIMSLLVGGGVSANSLLRTRLRETGEERAIDVRLPAMGYCVDNAAMIGGLAYHLHQGGLTSELSLRAAPTAAC